MDDVRQPGEVERLRDPDLTPDAPVDRDLEAVRPQDEHPAVRQQLRGRDAGQLRDRPADPPAAAGDQRRRAQPGHQSRRNPAPITGPNR